MTIHDLAEYEILDEHRVEDVQSDGFILRHKKSGARIAILSNNDDNKVFYIGFRTPPEDETGVPHIIEHTTLCGSKKFPCLVYASPRPRATDRARMPSSA